MDVIEHAVSPDKFTAPVEVLYKYFIADYRRCR